ncbi:hypothetical protein CMT52_13225 [Elizabethkingia anophelis]|nr:hypothetical protein [Elizabethkingia anophelis]MDV4025292.1 hypothetical protein [Elizabethkingia anophelis]
MIFFICNPNNYFYSGHEKALLSKEYIYNVAISRAKDYLIILYPYTKILKTKNIEEFLFKDSKFIENNTYVSGHDNVNVFGLSEMKYFIKANDAAIDIQIKPL